MSGNYDDAVGVEVSSDSFWELGNYKRQSRDRRRARLCNELMNCIRRASENREGLRTASLTEWAKRWKQLVEKGPQYGTVEKAWHALMTEAERVSELHLEVKNALMNDDFEKVKNWQKEAYHKQMMGGFKETKEAEDGFRKAQKPWAKKLKEVEGSKKAYHAACKEEKLAISRETNSKADPALNPEQLKKLQDKVEKSKVDSQKTKEKYEKTLKDLDGATPQYMENMEQVFEQCQQFEDKRLRFFKDLLLDVEKHLDLSNSDGYSGIYRDLEYAIKSADVLEDLKWFKNNHGPGMSMNWPQFEEWSADLNRTLSRREKKKPGEGVTLTGISQAGEGSLQNKHSRWVMPITLWITRSVIDNLSSCSGLTLISCPNSSINMEAIGSAELRLPFTSMHGRKPTIGRWIGHRKLSPDFTPLNEQQGIKGPFLESSLLCEISNIEQRRVIFCLR
ncbi:hypothetical protein GDO81_011074 [Engystomops pustulosus]|uniref:F-BAR domain-containing protein n=2 Tax=Engystomops pustulosus TaxID=76066 RepID=A0AAV7C5P1_ENGPU|nr:hypothetical protein GDO81_011074 [Engystomops pustulosus]